MRQKLIAFSHEAVRIRACAEQRVAAVHRPVQNEVLLHLEQSRHMLSRAKDLGLLSGPDAVLEPVLVARRDALAAARRGVLPPDTVTTEREVWEASLRDDYGVDIELPDGSIEGTLFGYFAPTIRAIGMRGLKLTAGGSYFNPVVYLKFSLPVFP